MNYLKPQGFSLVMVIMLTTVLSLMTVTLMSQLRNTNNLATQISDQFTEIATDQTQLTREILEIRQRLSSSLDEKTESSIDSKYSGDVWSFQYDSSAVSGDVTPQLACSADDLFAYSLLVKNEGTPFVMSNGCYLDDDLVLADSLVQYSPPRLKFHDVVKGELTLIDQDNETLVSSKLIQAYTSQFASYLDSEKEEGVRTDRTSLPLEVIDVTNQLLVISGDLSGPFYLGSDDLLDTLVVSGSVTFTQDTRIAKPLVIVAGMDVFFKDSLTATNLVVYCKGGLYLENSSKVRGTFYSEKQILVTDYSKCLFPSNLIVPTNDAKIYGQPEIAILKNAGVEGFVCVYDPESKRETKSRYSLSAKVKKERTATLFGGIYCEGSVEATGRIDGFVRADRFEQVIKRTRWVNYLQDIQILRKSIGPDFPLPPFFNKPDHLKVLKVNYL